MLHFVRRRSFFGCVLGFIVLFAAGSLAKGAEGESRIKTARKECRTIIAEGLDSENARVRVAAVRAVGEFLGETHKFDGDRPEEILKRALGDPSLQVAYAAARFLPDTDRGKKVIERYVQHLADEGDVLSRLERIRLLELDKELEYVKKKALSAEDTKVRAEALRTLGVLGGAEAISTVMQTYSEKDPAIQVASRNALWKLQFRGEVVEICEFADSKKPLASYLCAVRLRERMGFDRRTSRTSETRSYFLSTALMELLQDPKPDTRRIAARAVGDALWLKNLIRSLHGRLKQEKCTDVKVAMAGALLKHLNTEGVRAVEARGYNVLPGFGWDQKSYKLFSSAAEIASKRGDSEVTIGHLLIAFGHANDEAVGQVLSEAKLRKQDVENAGRILLAGVMIPNTRKWLLRIAKKRFDPQTMEAFDPESVVDRALVYTHIIRSNSQPIQKELMKYLRKKRNLKRQDTTVRMLWDGLVHTLKVSDDDQLNGVHLWLKEMKRNRK